MNIALGPIPQFQYFIWDLFHSLKIHFGTYSTVWFFFNHHGWNWSQLGAEKVPIILGPFPPPIGTYSTLKLCGTNRVLFSRHLYGNEESQWKHNFTQYYPNLFHVLLISTLQQHWQILALFNSSSCPVQRASTMHRLRAGNERKGTCMNHVRIVLAICPLGFK